MTHTASRGSLFGVDKNERTSVFIDGQFLHLCARTHSDDQRRDYDIDFAKLREEIAADCRLVQMNYYATTAISNECLPIKNLLKWLQNNEYEVVERVVKTDVDNIGRKHNSGGIQVDLACDVVSAAYNGQLHRIVIIGNEESYAYPAQLAKAQGTCVTFFGYSYKRPFSSPVIREAGRFVELTDVMPHITNLRAERPQIASSTSRAA